MANICSFSMKVIGKEENIAKFIDMMKQKGTVWMGRGATVDFTDIEELENGKYGCQIGGDTKWSVKASMIGDAIRMRTEPDKWYFGDDVDKTKLTFITLYEACEQLQLDMEVYSEEPGCGFQEHYVFVDGQLVTEETTDYTEEYNEETDEWESSGGFEWDFEI